MSKVYRYMLRKDDEQLVTVSEEIKFLDAYMYLLNTRYGTGLKISVNVDEADKEKMIPPLTLQVIIENTFSQNTLSKDSPLLIKIYTWKNQLIVENNIQPKMITDIIDFDRDLDNLVKKYQLLNRSSVDIEISDKERNYLYTDD